MNRRKFFTAASGLFALAMAPWKWAKAKQPQSLNSLLSADVKYGQPSLRPGDVVRTPKGNVGVIVDAHTIVNGCRLNWDQFPLNAKVEHGWLPDYRIEMRSHTGEKSAWWHAAELAEVLSIGPFHE